MCDHCGADTIISLGLTVITGDGIFNAVCNNRMLCQYAFSVSLPCIYWTYSILTLNQWYNFYVVISAHVSCDHPVDMVSQSQMVSHYWISLPNEKMVQFYIHDMAGLGLLLWRTEGVMCLKNFILLCCTATEEALHVGWTHSAIHHMARHRMRQRTAGSAVDTQNWLKCI